MFLKQYPLTTCVLCRGLARAALAGGDRHAAAHHYGGIVAKAAIGRGRPCWWAQAEYGWLMFEEGRLEAAKEHLETAMQVNACMHGAKVWRHALQHALRCQSAVAAPGAFQVRLGGTFGLSIQAACSWLCRPLFGHQCALHVHVCLLFVGTLSARLLPGLRPS